MVILTNLYYTYTLGQISSQSGVLNHNNKNKKYNA